VKHVAGCAQGIDIASHLVAPDGTVSLLPMEQSLAQKILTDMVSCLYKGLCQPLPVTSKTGLAFAHALITKDEEDAKAEAAKTYEGNDFKSGELDYDLYLRRAYPGFEDLWQAHGNHFIFLCQILYHPLVEALEEE
jgi:exodeoxyribonuclease V gamma subunit